MALKPAKKWLIVLVILGIAVSLFFYMKLSKPQIAPAQTQERVWLVQTLALKAGSHAPTTKLYGTVESSQHVSVSASVSAVLERLHVQAGDFVAKGEPIFTLNEQDVTIPVQQAKADVNDIQAQIALQALNDKINVQRLAQEKKIFTLKEDAVDRSRTLLSRSLASQAALDAAKEALVRQEYAVLGAEQAVKQNDQQLAQLKARLVKAQQALSRAEIALQRAKLIAPYDLRIASVTASEGELLSLNQPILSYYALDSLELKAKLSNVKVPHVLAYLEQNVDTIALIDWQKGLYQMTLERLDGEADASGVNAYFKMPVALSDVRVGALLSFELLDPAVGESFVVPYSALYGNNRIYLVEKGRLVRKSVEVRGQKRVGGKPMAIITGALKTGDVLSITHLPNAIQDLKVVEAE